jgi:hypothetical protein
MPSSREMTFHEAPEGGDLAGVDGDWRIAAPLRRQNFGNFESLKFGIDVFSDDLSNEKTV